MEKKRKVIHCRFRKLQPAPCLSNGETRDTEHVLPTQTRSEPWYVLTEPRLGAHARLDQLATVFLAFHSPTLGSARLDVANQAARHTSYQLSAKKTVHPDRSVPDQNTHITNQQNNHTR